MPGVSHNASLIDKADFSQAILQEQIAGLAQLPINVILKAQSYVFLRLATVQTGWFLDPVKSMPSVEGDGGLRLKLYARHRM